MNYQQLASKGRFGDTELYNINRKEAALLRALGGSGTINPNTGLREYSHKWWHPGGTIGGFLDSAVDAGSNLWNETLGNEGIGGAVGDIFTEGGSDIFSNAWNNILGNQGLGGYIGGGQAGTDLSNLWNNTYGNQGIGGYLFGGQAGTDLSNMWNNTYGNQGIGGWLGGFMGGGGGYQGQGPGLPPPKPGYPAQPPGSQGSSIWSQILGPGYTGTSPGWGGLNMPSSESRNPYDRPAPPPTPPTPPPPRPGMQGGA